MLTRLLILLALLIPTAVSAADLNPTRTVVIDMPITSGTLAPIQKKMTALLRDPSTATVNIVISSPGGEVVSGFFLVNQVLALQAKGVDVDCYVTDMAASMAFQLFTQCTNRYALTNSFLLWHGVRTSAVGPITTQVALAVAEDLARMDETVLRQLDTTLNLDIKAILRHFNHETLWSGLQLHRADSDFMEVADAFPAVTKVLGAEGTTYAARGGFFMEVDGHISAPAEFKFIGPYYLWSKYDYLLGEGRQP